MGALHVELHRPVEFSFIEYASLCSIGLRYIEPHRSNDRHRAVAHNEREMFLFIEPLQSGSTL